MWYTKKYPGTGYTLYPGYFVYRVLGLGSINGANHNFPLLLPLSIQNIWASIQNVWCAPPIEYFILLLSHNDTDKYLLYHGDSRVITSSFLQHRRRSRSSRLSSKMFSPTDAKIRLTWLKTRSMEALDVSCFLALLMRDLFYNPRHYLKHINHKNINL